MNTDHFLKIGKLHKVCEDYILSGLVPFPYVVLSDGCSSSKDTDIGARILCHLARSRLREINRNGFIKDLVFDAKDIIDNMQIDLSCLDATLLIATKDEIHMWGDGVIIFIMESGIIRICHIEYESGAPYYPIYYEDYFKADLYSEKFGDKKKTVSQYTYYPEIRKWFFDGKYAPPYSFKYYVAMDTRYMKCVLISSDGMNSFISNSGENCQIQDAAKEFSSFKNNIGEFIQRRSIKAVKEFEKNNFFHTDDLSIGGIWLED